jgi:uncharacterized protein with PIN domain
VIAVDTSAIMAVLLNEADADAYKRRIAQEAGCISAVSARLNCGDCAAYALAKSLTIPLLFKGTDFAQTDIVPALPTAA